MMSRKRAPLKDNDVSTNVQTETSAKKQMVKKSPYVEGAIVRIQLRNLLTYDNVEFNPGPYLNVIIGPNGTGKSTIVCAICLGLAGKTSWLGRASQPCDFIKYGCDKAKIELELHNPNGDNWFVQREISKNNQSTWTVNKRPATQKAVEEMAARLNIQVGNLCQFLPQEKVADFAKMTQQELLENTEKAIGAQDLYENHQKLKDARSNARRIETSVDSLTARLEQEKQKNVRLEQDVKNYEDRRHHLEKIKIMQMKRPWLEYEEKRKQFNADKLEKEAKEEEFKRAQAENQPMRDKMEEARGKKESLDAHIKKKSNAIREHANKVRDCSEELEKLTDKISEVQDELKYKQHEEEQRKKKLNDLHHQLAALQQELQEVDETEDVQPALDKLSQDMRIVNQDMTHVQQEGNVTRISRDAIQQDMNEHQVALRQIQDISNRRLELLRQRHKHTYEAVTWLRQNKNKFKKNIYEPMLLCLNVKNPDHAKYIESHISFNDIRAFVCEDPDDLELFMSVMRDEQKLKVNIVRSPQQAPDTFNPSKSIEYYRQYGFKYFLRDLIDCPAPIMSFLCAQYHVFEIPVGAKLVGGKINQVIKENPHLRVFYTEDCQYNVKKSKYTGDISTRNTQLRRAQLLSVSVDVTRQEELRQQIRGCSERQQEAENQYRALQMRSKELEVRMNQLRETKKNLMKKKDQKNRLLTQMNSKKERLKRVELEANDMAAETQKAAKKVKDITIKKCQLLGVLVANTKKCFELSKEKIRLALQHAECLHEFHSTEMLLRDRSASLQTLERQLHEMKEKLRNTRGIAKGLLEKAKQATNTAHDEELSKEYKMAFECYPSSVEEIDAAIHERQARADCTFQSDERVICEYRKRKEEIARLEAELEKKMVDKTSHQAEIEDAKRQWMEPLQQKIAQINNNFGYFFTCMKCTGEVDLNIPPNPEDYEKYGVRIKVKYRDGEQLRELTQHHQSGGERSVATVLYLMALQEMGKSPFRCVDEINQGMDPINERKVFELVVQTVCKKSNSQYFLLTPKLLPDLDYADNMSVLCICNGPQMMAHTEWNLRKFQRRRQRLSEEN
ncbi:structural maintenance of chromosomes protein 5-like [Gigantopelta aegis]|uniref:structural maintenance of chromosomes protein 5-like n=1 Tax=Gigantopelta aegis TaxID=1735272 RepID=UPI001B88E622|nr:structural maintenance of chromosomes protein 5-like [Gigantopelta aegis]